MSEDAMHDLDGLAVGVHYYRAPTPVPAEWDGDLANIKRMGFDFIQVRSQWRWHERNEGDLRFDDLDALFDLAQRHGLKVLIQVYVPCAPQWLFDNYDVLRRTTDGEPLRPVTYGATYVGGFAPCFDRPLVRAKANRFIRALAERYRDHASLLAWSAWNEPRSRPAGECACDESMSRYRQWLKARFGTVEGMNDFFGLALSGTGNDFSSVPPPDLYSDYPGWLLFRTWRTQMIADRIGWVAREIREVDDAHPIMSHSGMASVFQDVLEDTTNDYLNAMNVDLYGSSCPSRSVDMPLLASQAVAYQAATIDLLCARLRAISDPVWINELYGNEPMCLPATPPSFFRRAVYHATASGAKGIVYWQYRGERLSTESFDAGLTEVSGEPTPRSREVARVTKVLKSHEAFLAAARVPRAAVAMPYHFQSDLMSRIEAAEVYPGRRDEGPGVIYPYKTAMRGAHLAMWELDVPVDVIPAEDYESLLEYRVVYLSCPRIVSASEASTLAQFVERGGLLICDPSPGMRAANGWLEPRVPPGPLARLLGGSEISRALLQHEEALQTECGPITCPTGTLVTTLEAHEGPRHKRTHQVIASWEGGGIAAMSHQYGGGTAVYLGAPLGEIYFHTRSPVILDWLSRLLASHNVGVERVLRDRQPDVRARRMLSPDGSEVVFIFNYRGEATDVSIARRGMKRAEEVTDLGVLLSEDDDCFTARIPPEEVLIARLSK